MKCTDCGKVVRPVVVVDVDGTLADYHTTFGQFCARYYNFTLDHLPWDGSGEFEDYLGMTKAEYREAKLAYRQGGNKRWLPMYAGAREVINSLRVAGAEVWIATTRPWQRLDNVDPDTREWLRRNGLDVDGLLYGEDKYRQVLEIVGKDRVVAAVEDLADQFDQAQDLGLPVIMVERPHNAATSRTPRGSIAVCQEWALHQVMKWKEAYSDH